MTTKSQIKATSTHRRRAAARGLVRVEVQAARGDAGLIRAIAETLRSKPGEGQGPPLDARDGAYRSRN